MTVTIEETRRLASIETIVDVRAIDGADAIEAVTVRGWTVVVRKGEFKPGDSVLYIEVDAALPLDDPRFAFLESRGSKEFGGRRVHVLKTAKLRGVYSQGIVFPLDDFPEAGATCYDCVDEALGIEKWEPPLPQGMAAIGPFPSFLRKSDAERVQNLDAETWTEIQESADQWLPVEKIDGSSLTAWKDLDGVLHVAGRNWELDSDHFNAHWAAASYARLGEHLRPGEWIQGEVAGPGVQGNPLALTKVRLFAFAFGTTDFFSYDFHGRDQWQPWVADLAAPVVGYELPHTVEGAIEQVESMKSTVSPGRLAEGVVWTQRYAEGLPGLNGRHVWKSISAKYLLKHGG